MDSKWTMFMNEVLKGTIIRNKHNFSHYTHNLDTNLYIKQVEFIDINYKNGKGGAICVEKSISVLIETSVFKNVMASGEGGAIFIRSANSDDEDCSIKTVCATSTLSSGGKNFCYIEVGKNANNINYMIDSSIDDINSPGSSHNTYLNGGTIEVKNSNLSRNHCSDYCELRSFPSSPSTISMSSFVNNSASGSDGIVFENNDHKMNKCNMINTEHNDKSGCIRILTKLEIYDSNFIGNNIDGTTFWITSGSLKLINCIIDNDNCRNGDISADSQYTKIEPNQGSEIIYSVFLEISNGMCNTDLFEEQQKTIRPKRYQALLRFYIVIILFLANM